MNFYTNVDISGNYILLRGVEDNKKIEKKIPYHPTLYLTSKNPTHKTLFDVGVEEIQPGNIWDCRQFIKKYDGVEGFNIYGNTDWIIQYIGYNYSDKIEWEKESIKIYSIDIETEVEGGFPDVRTATEKIQLITLKDYKSKKIITWGYKPISFVPDDFTYKSFTSEASMLVDFLSWWSMNYPDIITGWNSNLFDQTYITNRILRVLGEESAKKLSPWNIIKNKDIESNNNVYQEWTWVGISHLDYLDLYKKFTYTRQESYKLEYIANVELNITKIENPYNTFKEFYTNDWDLFVKYNVRDTDLIDKLEEKKKLIYLVLMLAYESKVNYNDVFSPVKTWDAFIFNDLLKDKIVVPQKKNNIKIEYDGAYVKEPEPGFYNWVMSFDIASMYPSIIIAYNLSPETILNKKVPVNIDKMLKKEEDFSSIQNDDICISANGVLTRKDKIGVLPKLTQYLFDQRKIIKKEMLRLEDEVERGNIDSKNNIDELDVKQHAIKIFLNSLYGAAANIWFRYYSIDLAEAITLSGQFIIKWIEKKINEDLSNLTGIKKDYVIGLDTDSCIINAADIVKTNGLDGKSITEITNFLDKFASEYFQSKLKLWFEELVDYTNAIPNKFSMKREVIGNKAFWTKKKRYVINVIDKEGVRYSEPKMKVIGLEIVRSSTPKIIRTKLKEAVSIIINHDQETLIQFINNFRKEFNKLPVQDISSPRGITDIDKWECIDNLYKKSTPIHVRGSILFNKLLKDNKIDYIQKIKNGDKIYFTYLKVPNPIKEDVISFPGILPHDFGLHKYVDYDTQFDKNFLEPLKHIANAIKWRLEETSDLMDLFS